MIGPAPLPRKLPGKETGFLNCAAQYRIIALFFPWQSEGGEEWAETERVESTSTKGRASYV
jgi:hypothetical protein